MKKVRFNINPKLTGVIIALLVLLYWVWLICTTQPAKADNTYHCQEIICEVDVRLASHRGNDKLYIYTNNCRYMLDTGWRNEQKTQAFAEQLLLTQDAVDLTVWEHFPRGIFEFVDNNCKVRQVVDLRNTSDVYWDIEEHNEYQRSERIIGTIAGIIVSLLAGLYSWLVWLV